MSIEQEIKQIVDDKIKIFTEIKTEKNFLERVKKENELATSYKDRELLELLQNIDDAYDKNCGHPCEAYVVLDDEYIYVSNYGRPFNYDTLQRLCQGNVSGKQGAYIGCKGIGFRSILNWSDEIYIYSGKGENCYSVRFSKKYAKEQFDKIKENEHIKKQVKELEATAYNNGQRSINFDISFPMLQAPQYIDPTGSQYTDPRTNDYDTLIKIKFRDESLRKKIKANITKFDKSILLFLPNIKKIKLCIKEGSESKNYVYEKKIDGNKVKIRTIENGKDVETRGFILEEREKKLDIGDEYSKNIKMAIAIPEMPQANYGLYTFFPILDERSPFKALLHATFCLSPNRNQLDNDKKELNKAIFKALLDFYVDFVTKNIEPPKCLELLMPVDMHESLSESFEFPGGLHLGCENHYINKCCEYPVFSNVNAEALKKSDYPVILYETPRVLEGSSFRKIVNIYGGKLFNFALKIIDGNISSFEKYKQYCKTKEANILYDINMSSAKWTVQQRVQVFKWWHNTGMTSLPRLLYDKDGNFLSKDKTCFLSGSTVTDLPSWSKITILGEDDEKELLNVYASDIRNVDPTKLKRSLAEIIPKDLIDIQEQSAIKNMISPVNMSIGENYNHAVEFVQWLWKIWKRERFAESTKNTSFKLPANDGSVKPSKDLYLGSEYGNVLGEEFFKNLSYKKLATIKLEDSGTQESEWEIKEFFADLGVMEYPEPKLMDFEESYQANTYYSLKNEQRIAFEFFKEIFEENKPFDGEKFIEATSYKLNVNCVENICDILEKADYYSILEWLVQSKKMKVLLERTCDAEAKIEYKPRKRHQQKYEILLPTASAKCPSFLYYILSRKKWLEVDGQKIAPQDLLITNNEIFKSDFKCFTERDLDSLADKVLCDKAELKRLLINLGAKDGILGCDSKTFYGFLLKLPGKEGDSKKVSREIYRAIIDNNRDGKRSKDAFFKNSEEKVKFFKEGKVLAKNRKGVCEYKPVTEVFFSSSAVFNLNDFFFIDVPTRSGRKDDFKEILNVSPYEIDYSISGEPEISICNRDFEKDFKDYLPYLMTYRVGKKDYVCDLNIQLVKKVIVEISNTPQEVTTPYTLLKSRSNRSWFIYVGDLPRYADLKKEKVAELLVQVFNVLLNFPSKDFLSKVSELFIYTSAQRKYLVESDFGSLEDFKSTQNEIALSESIRESIKNRLLRDGIRTVAAIAAIDSIDWFDSSTEYMQEKIVDLLRLIGKDVPYLNEIVEKKISIKPYNQKRLMLAYGKEEDSYRQKVYHALKQENYALLKQVWKDFENKVRLFSSDSIESASFDAEEVVKNIEKDCLETNKAYFDAEKMASAEANFVDYKKIYQLNQDKLKDRDHDDMLSAFTNIDNNDSLLYFEDSSYEEAFDAFVEEQEAKNEKEKSLSIETIENLFKNTTVSTTLTKGSPKENTGSSGGSATTTASARKNKKMKQQGNLAEYFVVLKLLEREISEVNDWFDGKGYEIHWVSEASKKVKTIASDTRLYDVTTTNSNAGFDIKLTAKEGNKILYLEVKSSSSDGCSFLMSSNEYHNSIKLNAEKDSQYRVIFVTGMESDLENSKPVIHFVSDPIENESVFEPIPLKYNIVYKGIS